MFKTILNRPLKQSFIIIAPCFALTLFLICIYSLYNHFKCLNDLEEKYQIIENITLSSLQKRKEKIDFLNKYKNSNPNYLTDFFNKKSLLAEEKSNLTYLSLQPFFYQNSILAEKLAKIDENKFDYLLGDSFENKNINENTIALKYPIRCSYSELIEILSTIDNISINQTDPRKVPQLIPYDLYIEFNDSDCILDCKLLQREFYQ